MSDRIIGNHHITLSTGGAQEDWDFYTQTLGMRPSFPSQLDGEVVIARPALDSREVPQDNGQRAVVALVDGAGSHDLQPGA